MKNIHKIIVASILITVLGVVVFPVFGKTLRERDREARVRYHSARQQYLKEVKWWKNTRQQFLSARKKYRQFKNVENKSLYEKQARNFLTRTVDVLIRKLESLKTWVSNRRALAEEQKQAIINELNQDINWLQQKKPGISTATPEQIRKNAKEIRDYWRNHRVKVKKIIGRIWAARLNWVISRFENVSLKISSKIEELKAKGIDTSQLESWLSDFKQKIELAKEKKEKAKEKYEAISSLSDANRLFKEAHQFIKEANQYLRQAHKKLVEIVKEMRRVVALSNTAKTSETGE